MQHTPPNNDCCYFRESFSQFQRVRVGHRNSRRTLIRSNHKRISSTFLNRNVNLFFPAYHFLLLSVACDVSASLLYYIVLHWTRKTLSVVINEYLIPTHFHLAQRCLTFILLLLWTHLTCHSFFSLIREKFQETSSLFVKKNLFVWNDARLNSNCYYVIFISNENIKIKLKTMLMDNLLYLVELKDNHIKKRNWR